MPLPHHGCRFAALAMLFLAACASPPLAGPAVHQSASADTDWDHAQTLAVRLTDFSFTPEHLTFQAGRPMRLTLVNDGSGKHDFSAPAFFAAAAFRVGSDAPAGGKIALKEKQTAEIDLVPMAAGKYPLECTEFLHAMFGMTGDIEVAAAPH